MVERREQLAVGARDAVPRPQRSADPEVQREPLLRRERLVGGLLHPVVHEGVGLLRLLAVVHQEPLTRRLRQQGADRLPLLPQQVREQLRVEPVADARRRLQRALQLGRQPL